MCPTPSAKRHRGSCGATSHGFCDRIRVQRYEKYGRRKKNVKKSLPFCLIYEIIDLWVKIVRRKYIKAAQKKVCGVERLS